MKVRRGIFIALWVLSLIAISFYGGAISYGFFFGMTLIPVISFIYLVCVYLCFRIYQKLESRNTVCGEAVPFYFTLQNDGFCAIAGISVRLYSSFSFVENLPDDIEYELLPGDQFRYDTKLICKYRGEYEVGVKELIVTDFLKLIRMTYKVPGSVKARVLPKLVHLEALGSISEIMAFLQKESQTERTEPDIIVRDYMAGDAIKQIHWKASAKEGKLKTRNLIGEEKQGISILFDTKRYDKDIQMFLPLENKMLETVLALGLFFAEKNMPLSVLYGQRGMKRSRVEGLKSFDAIYTELSEVVFDKEENPTAIFDQALQQGELYKSRLVLCVFHEMNAEIIGMAEQLADSGVATVIYVITDQNMEEYLKQCGELTKIVVIPVEAELEGIL